MIDTTKTKADDLQQEIDEVQDQIESIYDHLELIREKLLMARKHRALLAIRFNKMIEAGTIDIHSENRHLDHLDLV